MVRLKKRYWILLTILLIITTVSVCGWRYWVYFKQQNGITLDWKKMNISFDGIEFDEFHFTKQSLLSLKSKNLQISWSTLWATDVDINWLSPDDDWQDNIGDTLEEINQNSNSNEFIGTIVYWLPNMISIDSLQLYKQDRELFNVKVDLVKHQETIQLLVASNNRDATQLSATLSLNRVDSRLDVKTGLLTAKLNSADIIKGQVTVPFTGWIKFDKLFFNSAENAIISAEKWIVSPDLMLTNFAGKVDFQFESSMPVYNEYITFIGQLTIDKLDGIYKQSDIKSVTGNGTVTVKNNQLDVSIAKMNIQSVNLGIVFEKLKLAGTYLAPLDALAEGQITWSQAQANIFSGILSLGKNKVNLAKLPQQFNVQLKQIQLKDVFDTYPVDGLAGDGSVEGTLPITLSSTKKNGVTVFKTSIKNGQLATVRDGYLQFENSALRNYVQTNPQMKIVTDVIKNFHYTNLTGNLDYQDDIAKLKLNIQGRNPETENGKAVNLNITLEENIPKLIMSLQLSEQISEPIRKRIEERLK